MSTKTLRKRIALVAVSALGFGLVSTVPALAAIGDTTYSVANSSVTVVVGQQATVGVIMGTVTGTSANGETIVVTPTVEGGVPITIDAANPATETLGSGWAVTATGTGALTATHRNYRVGICKTTLIFFQSSANRIHLWSFKPTKVIRP